MNKADIFKASHLLNSVSDKDEMWAAIEALGFDTTEAREAFEQEEIGQAFFDLKYKVEALRRSVLPH